VELRKTGHGLWEGEDEGEKLMTGHAEVDELNGFLANQTTTSEDGCFGSFGERVVDDEDEVVDDVWVDHRPDLSREI
jgi:hypothetical protein